MKLPPFLFCRVFLICGRTPCSRILLRLCSGKSLLKKSSRRIINRENFKWKRLNLRWTHRRASLSSHVCTLSPVRRSSLSLNSRVFSTLGPRVSFIFFGSPRTITSVKEILTEVYVALTEKGYNPVNQIVGYCNRRLIKVSAQNTDFFIVFLRGILSIHRGRIRSRELSEVLDEVRTLAGNGYREAVLTGIHLSSYGMKKSMTVRPPRVLSQARPSLSAFSRQVSPGAFEDFSLFGCSTVRRFSPEFT